MHLGSDIWRDDTMAKKQTKEERSSEELAKLFNTCGKERLTKTAKALQGVAKAVLAEARTEDGRINLKALDTARGYLRLALTADDKQEQARVNEALDELDRRARASQAASSLQ
jgi:hypothetical protein